MKISNPFKTLFETAHLRFTSPYLLGDCMTRLRKLRGLQWAGWSFVYYHLKWVHPTSPDNFGFVLLITIPRSGIYFCSGEFCATADGRTEVAVEFEVHPLSRLTGLLIVGIIGIAAIVTGLTGYGLLSPVLLVMVGVAIFLLHETTVYARTLIFDEIKTKLVLE